MSQNHLSEKTLNAYLDGELAGGEREQVEAHLGTCETCRVEVETLQRASAEPGAGHADPHPPPP